MSRQEKNSKRNRPAGGRKAPGAGLLLALFLAVAGIDVGIYLWFRGLSPDQPVAAAPSRMPLPSRPASNVTEKAVLPARTEARANSSPERTVALQVALDRLGFSPGVVDGQFGSQTRSALIAWQSANALKPTGEFDAASRAALALPENPYADDTITADDLSELGDVPEDWRERSQRSRMPYQTIVELVAERAHASETFIRRLNPQITDWTGLRPGQTVRVPDANPGDRARPAKASRLRVYLGSKFVRAYREDGSIVAHFPCSIAAREEKRPVGLLTVESVVLGPDYTFDPSIFPELDPAQKSYGKLIVPPGPNNPVGTAWIGLSQPGYGIHGTPHPEQIGRTESHGCFRLANWNAERLARMIVIGTPVEVVQE